MEGMEYGGIVVFSIMMALANIAGIGGGGIAIPIVMAFFHFNTKPAIAISSFSIFMTTLARFVMNFKLAHPEKKNSVIIDYNLVTIMMPTTLAGSQIGALILVVFPSLYIQIALTITLILLGGQSTMKAIEITKKENAAAAAAKKLNTVVDESQIKKEADEKKEEKPAADAEEGKTDEKYKTEENDEGKVSNFTLQNNEEKAPEDEDKKDDTNQEITKEQMAKMPEGDDKEDEVYAEIVLPENYEKEELASLKRSLKLETGHRQWLK